MMNNLFRWFVLIVCIILGSACSSPSEKQETAQTIENQHIPIENTIEKEKERTAAEASPLETTEFQGMIPQYLEIPAIEVSASVEKVRLEENGQMGVPDSSFDVGWFSEGYYPGKKGNAVLAGHVDDKNGPAVFFYLKDLKAGDLIYLHDANDQKLTFVVKEIKSYPYDQAPLEEIFGSSEAARLNLITCTGDFDRSTGNHAERLVVFTELQTASPKTAS